MKLRSLAAFALLGLCSLTASAQSAPPQAGDLQPGESRMSCDRTHCTIITPIFVWIDLGNGSGFWTFLTTTEQKIPKPTMREN